MTHAFLLALMLLVTPALANAGSDTTPAAQALAALREMRVLNYRIQTRFHVGALAGNDTRPFDGLRRDVARFDALMGVLRTASHEGGLRVAVSDVDARWQAVRWFTTNDLPVRGGEPLPKDIAYDRARRPASIAPMKIAGQQLAASLVDAMMAIPGPREPQSNIDFALAALEFQYIAYRYADLAGIDPLTDDTNEPSLAILEAAFVRRRAMLVQRYGNDPRWQEHLDKLDVGWRFVQPALASARVSPIPILVSAYVAAASEALRSAYSPIE